MEQSTLAYLITHRALRAISMGRYSEATALLTETLGTLAGLVNPTAPDRADGEVEARPRVDRVAVPARDAA